MIVRDLWKRYGETPVLRGVSFTANAGVTAILAPSGAGKTTLLRILLGLETADRGEIADAPTRWAAVFQEDRLLENGTAEENLRFVLGGDYDEDRAREMLAALALTEVDHKRVRDYSGGMKRRLALARALLAPSDALALDEPFTGLDEENRRLALAQISLAAREKPVLLVTHEEGDAAALRANCVSL